MSRAPSGSPFAEFLDARANFGITPSLAGIRALAQVLGNPQEHFRAIQVTGTNGKSSVTRMVAALLQAHAFSTGAYLSPDLNSYTERFLIDGAEISRELFEAVGQTVMDSISKVEDAAGGADPRAVTQFEALTAAALETFTRQEVDTAVLEVGMGGRWDATSVCRPEVAVITNVTLDHAEWLGPELTDIAAEKAHVVKKGTVGVVGETDPALLEIFKARAEEVGGRLLLCGSDFSSRHLTDGWEFSTPLSTYSAIAIGPKGQWQPRNALLATVAAEAYAGRPLDAEAVREALSNVVCPGRAEFFPGRPDFVFDGAHNLAGIRALVEHLRQAYRDREPVFIVSILKDKAAAQMIEELGRAGRLVVVAVDNPRRLTAGELGALAEECGFHAVLAASVEQAIDEARAASGAGGLVVVTGSLYLVGEARGLFLSPKPSGMI